MREEQEKWTGRVNLSGGEVEYTVRVSQKAKHMRLVVGIGTGLEVVVPLTFNDKDLDSILVKNQKWILDKLKNLKQFAQNTDAVVSDIPESIYYRGLEYRVETRIDFSSPPSVLMEKTKFVIFIPEEHGVALLKEWLRKEARWIIHQRVQEISERLSLKYNRIFIRDQKTRWGSCSSKKNLNFNWRLVMAPPEVLDYVVVHELMHLLEQNHSKKFWALVEMVCPNFKTYRSWLKEYAPRLSF